MPTWDQTLIFHPSSLIPHPHRQDALGNDGRSYHTIIKENTLKCLHGKVADVSNLPGSKEGRKFIMKEALSKLTWDGLLMGWMFMVETVRPPWGVVIFAFFLLMYKVFLWPPPKVYLLLGFRLYSSKEGFPSDRGLTMFVLIATGTSPSFFLYSTYMSYHFPLKVISEVKKPKKV